MIYTWSKFNYGQQATLATQSIPFKEGSSSAVLTGIIPIGGYTLSQYAQSVADAMNAAGSLVYQTSVNRATNAITVTGSGNFSLLTSQSATAFPMMGFTSATDLSGANAYTGAAPCGSQYYPQFKLQSYVPASNFAQAVSATINQSASGIIEVVRFGVSRLIEFELKFITGLKTDGTFIRNNQTGVTDCLSFLDFAIQKTPFEFVPDIAAPAAYTNVLLESTDAAKDGTGYKLKELISDNVPDVYESGVITLRVLT